MRGLASFLILAACSGRDNSVLSGTTGSELTSLAPTRMMGELTDVEKKQLCEDFKAFQKKSKPSDDEARRMSCQAQAAMMTMSAPGEEAKLRAACKQQFDACIAKQEKPPEPELDCNSPEFLGQMSVCKELTIGEISACVADLSVVMKKLAAEDLCGGLKLTPGQPLEMAIFEKMKSPKCEVLETKCKGKVEAGSGSNAPLPELEKQTIIALTGFKTKMCACKDKACAEPLRQQMNDWGQTMATKHPEFRPSPEVAQQIALIVNDYTNCMLKVAADDPKPSPLSGSGSGSGSGK